MVLRWNHGKIWRCLLEIGNELKMCFGVSNTVGYKL